MKLLYAPSTKSAPTAASERLRIKARAFSKRLSSRTSVAAREGPAFVRKVDVFWVNGIELTKTWGINVWAAEPADFEYSEQMRDSTGKFAPNPDEHSAKTKLGVVPEEGKGHGVVALERIREGREACKVIGATHHAHTAGEAYLRRQGLLYTTDAIGPDNKRYKLEQTWFGNVSRKGNHACFEEANLELVYEAVGGEDGPRRLVLVAKRDIEVGEFLSWDNNIAFEDCQCRSYRHRTVKDKQVMSRVRMVAK